MHNAPRHAGAAGLLFALSLVAGFSLQPAVDFDASPDAFAKALADGKAGLLASGLFMAVAAVALAWFSATLPRALGAQDEPAAAVIAPAGAIAGCLLAFGFVCVGALAAWAPAGGADAAALQTAGRLANTATNVALLPLAAAGLAVALLRRAPAWIGALGVLAGAASVVAAGRAMDELGFLSLLLWLVWAAGLGVILLRRRIAQEPALSAA